MSSVLNRTNSRTAERYLSQLRFGSSNTLPMTPKALRSIRIALGLSVRDFSARIGMAADHIQNMETGDARIDPHAVATALERLAPYDDERPVDRSKTSQF
jgi:DNA-binding transcriptional regulator YiaG